MKRSEVYSWRVAPEIKAALQQEARRERQSVGSLLERIAIEWLTARRRAQADDEEEQTRLRAAATRTFGTISGRDPNRSTTAREAVRRRLAGRRAS